jgi:succinyl-CoA synthetase alpha subunit
MSVLVGRHTRLLVQGITGQAAAEHTRRMLAYGTQVVGGVVPGRGGTAVHGVPVYDTVAEAGAASAANASVLYLPPAVAAAGILEAAAAEVPLVVCLTEGVPLHDMLLVRERLRRSATRLLGPNVPGIVSPGEALVGFVPERACAPGAIGVASRSGTLAYECGLALVQA